MITNLLSVLGIKLQNHTGASSSSEAITSSEIEALSHSPNNVKATEIIPKSFVEMELDVAGWYAIGHHQPQDFITAITRREPRYSLTEQQVEQVWAKLDGQRGEYFENPVDGAQPITLLILWD